MNNLFAGIPSDLPQELIDTLLEAEGLRLQRIVSSNHSSAEGFWYQQQENEWVLVIQGAARLQIEEQDQELELKTGDYLNIPAGLRHRVSWTSADPDCIWLCLFYPA
ncbi:MAG: cupin domain-containing protein [Motiliproteus sp.]|nr:cupin domain-containing protein [Motiliproteus sp.]MCW9052111.1 cupin domain-containing protein [Motiliproteus sp.]